MCGYLRFIFFSLCFVFSQSSESFCENTHYTLLPDHDIFPVLIADPRESLFSMRRESYETETEDFSAAVVSFGDYLPALEIKGESDDEVYQLLIDGSLYALFNLDTSSYNLVNTDYYFGVSLAHGGASDFSYRLRLFHASSHLGDEFIIDNPGFERENSSYESIEYILSYQFYNLRLYGGSGYIVRANSDIKEKPIQLKVGFEYTYPLAFLGNMDAVLATHFFMQERSNWRGSVSLLWGLTLAKSETREIRLMANYYSGSSVQGQFYEDKLQYYGLGVYFIV